MIANAAAASSSLLQAQRLVLTLAGRRVVDQVTLALAPGQWTALVGPNGAGKSSLLGLLAGLRAPDAGQVLLDGRPLADWPARQRAQRLAWLSQQGDAEGGITSADVVALGRLPHQGLFGAPGATDIAAVQAAMAETASLPFASRPLQALSGGERQRVLLARALAVQSPVLLLDEPTTHLDAPHQLALVRSLVQRARAGAAVLAVMHDLNLALAADRLLVLHQGRLVADGPPADAVVRQRLEAVFEQAFTIEGLATAQGRRWVAVPTL